MNEPKAFASLSPSLLARKGSARPAMRPQLQPMQQFHEATARQLDDDLGWNDMGEDLAPAPKGEVVAFAAPSALEVAPEVASVTAPAALPEIVRQQSEIATRIEKASAPAPAFASKPVATPRRSALSSGRRAAFTLRLDSERHLKLRLASALANRSAQQLVTEALDTLIAQLPDVANVAAQLGKQN